MKKYILFISLLILSYGCQDQGEKVRKAKIETEHGDMIVELYNSTPKHRDNFVKLVNEGFYNDLLFHRIISGFMLQGGDPNSKNATPETNLGSGGPGYQIDAEIGAPHFKGTLAAARNGGAGNPEKRSSGSQFYIVQGNPVNEKTLQNMEQRKNFKYNDSQKEKYARIGGTPNLDGDYTVYGEIIEGMDVIDKIAAVKTAPGDRPIKDVKMKITMIN